MQTKQHKYITARTILTSFFVLSFVHSLIGTAEAQPGSNVVYRLTRVTPPPGYADSTTSVWAKSINDEGMVIGWVSRMDDNLPIETHAFTKSLNGTAKLVTETESYGVQMNNSGIGTANREDFRCGLLVAGGVTRCLDLAVWDVPPGYHHTTRFISISNNNLILAATSDGVELLYDIATKDVKVLPPLSFVPEQVNINSSIIGNIFPGGDWSRARGFFQIGGVTHELPNPNDAIRTYAKDINDRDFVLGLSGSPFNIVSYITNGSELMMLEPLPGDTWSQGAGINDHNQAVGQSGNPVSITPVIWNNGVPTRLADLVKYNEEQLDTSHFMPQDINNRGQILFLTFVPGRPGVQSYLLTPVRNGSLSTSNS